MRRQIWFDLHCTAEYFVMGGNTDHILCKVRSLRTNENSVSTSKLKTWCECMCPTWPKWPSSQDFAWGLLKQDNLCVYQACRTKSLAVQTATTAPSPAATTDRTSARPIQLRKSERTPCMRGIVEERAGCPGGLNTGPARPAVTLTVRSVEDDCCAQRGWHHFLCLTE